jgi:tetratricopeptide (TPR) repeat protein
MSPISSAAAALALIMAAGAAGAQPTPAPTPVREPNLLAAPFKAYVNRADPQIAATTEWLRIYAGAVVEDWATVRADALVLAERFPQSADAQVALAVGHEGVGEHAEAATALRRAAELQPGHLVAWLLLSQLDTRLGQFAEVAKDLEQARRLKPGDLDVLLRLGDAYVRSGDGVRAASVFAEATALAPDSVPAWVGFLDASTRAGKADQAWASFNQLRIGHPATAAAVVRRLPSGLATAVPTPIPPTPRPTPRTDTARLIMAAGPASGGTGSGTGSQKAAVWNQAALSFESKVADIARQARPLAELVHRYDLTCSGGAATRAGAASASAKAAEESGGDPGMQAQSRSEAVAVEVEWPAIWARSDGWTQAAASAPTSECRTLAADILALANQTRSAVEKTTQSTTGTGLSAAEVKAILQKYNLVL